MSQVNDSSSGPTSEPDQLSDDYLHLLEEDADHYPRLADISWGMLKLLQTGNPECFEGDGRHVAGAAAGCFLTPGLHPEVRDGEEGIIVTPLCKKRVAMEWLPGRMGLVDRHEVIPPDVEVRVVTEEGRERKRVVRKETGNLLVDTVEIYLAIEGVGFFLPCSSTKHIFARNFSRSFANLKHPKVQGFLPPYSHRYRLTSAPEDKHNYHYYGLKFEDLGLITDQHEYEAAKTLAKSAQDGGARFDMRLIENAAA